VTRRAKLRGNINKAGLPDGVFIVANVLIRNADPGTCITWMSQRELRQQSNGKSSRWVDDCLAHLERHRWVVRDVFGSGRNARTRYSLFTGEPCTCHPGPAASGKAKTGAERTAAWTARKAAANAPANSVSKRPVNSVSTAGQRYQTVSLNAPANPVSTAGQRPDLATSTGTTGYPTECPGEAEHEGPSVDQTVGEKPKTFSQLMAEAEPGYDPWR
jgi:hypothetical protein